MKKITLYITLILFISCQSKKWHYTHEDISKSWSSISSQNELCSKGTKQSPIDLSFSGSSKNEEEVIINYQDDYAEIINDGHTIKEEFKTKNHLVIGGVPYFLKQLHFHSHSEHSLNGIYYPLEIHFVHRSKDGKLAVLGVLVEVSSLKKNEFGFFKNIDNKKTFVKLSKLKNLNGGHFYYEGSLTTPPCTEGVKWIILDKHIVIEKSQLQPFQKYYRSNYRPVNRINRHKLYHSEI